MPMIKYLQNLLIKLFNRLDKPVIENRILLGQLLINAQRTITKPVSLSEVEFKVFSQHREDGIIQYLLRFVPIENKSFIEFGVGDYRESNTRFLLVNNNWKGLVIDSEKKFISRLKTYDFYWQYDITAIQAFINRENINELFVKNGFQGDIGLLSIDIDGNDYWVWDAITVIQPRIVICEYNSVFGKNHAVTIPYDQNFNRSKAHYSNLYYGCSLKALCILAEKKGYVFVGAETSGTNAFFVRKDVAQNLKVYQCDNGFIENVARQSRDKKGRLSLISGIERLKCIADKKVIDILTGKEISVSELQFF